VDNHFDAWQLVGGLGLFLFAMHQLERALRELAGRSFRKLLQRHTGNPFKAALAGTVTTGILQSSSLVGLMVLAFVGAGLMTLQNALGVIFGANLGTTLTGWVVTTLGFKLDLDGLALPLVGIGSLTFVITQNKVGQFGRVLASLGLLLLGLSFMKDSVASLPNSIDISQLANYSAWQFLMFGTIVAAVIQSSSATMLITLTALSSGVIDLPSAAAVAIGADLGTTTTVMLGAAQGGGGKKRVALAHLVFNLTTDILAFLLRVPLLALISAVGVHDPLFALVAFHSLFNLMGVILFLPFTGVLAKFLSERFATLETQEARYLDESTPQVSDAALVAVEAETSHLIARVVQVNRYVFSPPLSTPPGELPIAHTANDDPEEFEFDSAYRGTKKLEGELLSFAIKVQAEPMDPAQSRRLGQLMSAMRHAVHSAKSLRDVRHDLQEFEDSPKRQLNTYVEHFRSAMNSFYADLYRFGASSAPAIFRDFAELIGRTHEWHGRLHQEVVADISAGRIGEHEISSLLNVNRELLNSNLALIAALQEYHLDPAASEALNQLPGPS